MRSLWSGVSGLQAHQIAMDVEGNNIANVNTFGYKYGRTAFGDLMSQTSKVATGPDGDLGGRNPMQVGLGVMTEATTTIYKQGSLETTDKNTDIALDGDGFFVLSDNAGKSYVYTRNGDFLRDSAGNLVSNSGYIVQGWLRDETTGKIDPTTPMRNIVIQPGLSIPARATSEIAFKGNLDSGDSVGTLSSPIYSLDSHSGWLDKNGNNIKEDNELLGLSTTSSENDTSHTEYYVSANGQIVMREKGVDLSVLFDGKGDALNVSEGQGIWVSFADAKVVFGDNLTPIAQNNSRLHINLNGIEISSTVHTVSDVANTINNYTAKTGIVATVINGSQLQLTNQNNVGTTEQSKNIKIYDMGSTGISGIFNTNIITAYQYTYSSTTTSSVHDYDDSHARSVHTTEDLREAIQHDARLFVNYQGDIVDSVFDTATNTYQSRTAWLAAPTHGETADPINPNLYDNATYQSRNKNDGVEVTVNTQGQFVISNPTGDAFNENDGDDNDNTPDPGTGVQSTSNDDTFDNDYNMHITVTGLSNPTSQVTENTGIAKAFAALDGGLSTGSSTNKVSGALTMASFTMTTEIFDSLGSKHVLTVEFRKTRFDKSNGSEWSMLVRVPEPGVIDHNTNAPYPSVLAGSVKFGPDGAITSYNPSTITYSPNNGSASGQSISLNLGTLGAFNGLTSYDSTSTSENVSQDGYTGGTLKDIAIDNSGTIVGSFTNGKSMALAQVAVATFTNNSGLESQGGNVWIKTANSGEPVFGVAASGSRGKINASTLEMSNVDLSRSLTQLIIIQRGYQANSKTITTSDEMLNTLLQLK